MLFGNDFIEVYDGALSSYQWQEIIKHFDKQDLVRGAFGPDGRLDLLHKSSWEVAGGQLFSEGSPISLYIQNSLKKYLTKYLSLNPELNIVAEWAFDDEYNLQKYDPGEAYFTSHCENDSGDSRRILAWMFYLNSIKDQGGTHFDQHNKTLKAKEGRLVIWPAYWTHFHRGVVSKTETKYIATGWCSFV